ncbi:MAG: YitT family protein [Lachnospiraceae bacterium]
MNKRRKTERTIQELFIMTVATLIIAAAVFFFLIPSHAAVSSVSGLAIVLSNLVPLSVSVITMILNVVLLIAGFLLCGHEFGFKTVYTSILLPVFIGFFEILLPENSSLTGDAALDVVCYIFVVSIGLSILFNMNASSGGLDIVAKILNRYLHMDLGRAMSMSGMLVALSSALVYDKKTVVLSVLGTYLNGMVLDHFLFGQNMKRRVCIISKDKGDEISSWIVHTLKSGATIYQAKGVYDGIVRNEIITIVDKNEYQKLMQYIIREDPAAFVTVYNVNDMRYMPKNQM